MESVDEPVTKETEDSYQVSRNITESLSLPNALSYMDVVDVYIVSAAGMTMYNGVCIR